MVASRERITGVGATDLDKAECVTLTDAYARGVDWSFVTHAVLIASRRTPSDVFVRVAPQNISVHYTGCIPEHTRDAEAVRPVVVDCPKNKAERCADCILNIMGGEGALASLVERSSGPLLRTSSLFPSRF